MKEQLIFLLLLVALIVAYDFPGRLTMDEAVDLQGYCGRKFVPKINFAVNGRSKRSAFSTLANRTQSPWAVFTGCSGTMISKRHMLTSAHCIQGKIFGPNSFVQFNDKAQFDMPCSVGTTCPKVMYNITNIYYLESFLSPKARELSSDIAILVLEQDMELSEYIYPACLAGYAVNMSETFEQFGYGLSSDEESKETGSNRYGLLQTFTTIRVSYRTAKDHLFMIAIKPNTSTVALGGDSGSGFIHKRNGVRSVYSVMEGGNMGTVRVSAHLHWITKITGINVPDQDNQFDGYFYYLNANDKRQKKTYLAGARHPSKIISEKTLLEHVVNQIANAKICNTGDTWLLNSEDGPIEGTHIKTNCKLFGNYFPPCPTRRAERFESCQSTGVNGTYFVVHILDNKPTKLSPDGGNLLYIMNPPQYSFVSGDYPMCKEDLSNTSPRCTVEKYNL